MTLAGFIGKETSFERILHNLEENLRKTDVRPSNVTVEGQIPLLKLVEKALQEAASPEKTKEIVAEYAKDGRPTAEELERKVHHLLTLGEDPVDYLDLPRQVVASIIEDLKKRRYVTDVQIEDWKERGRQLSKRAWQKYSLEWSYKSNYLIEHAYAKRQSIASRRLAVWKLWRLGFTNKQIAQKLEIDEPLITSTVREMKKVRQGGFEEWDWFLRGDY
jgi:DNA-binding CsgD family transcriptional regulator